MRVEIFGQERFVLGGEMPKALPELPAGVEVLVDGRRVPWAGASGPLRSSPGLASRAPHLVFTAHATGREHELLIVDGAAVSALTFFPNLSALPRFRVGVHFA